MPIVRLAIEETHWLRCASNLKHISSALQNYADQYGSLPPAYLRDRAGKPILSWRVLMLPYLGYDDLYRQVKLDEAWDSPSNLRLARQIPHYYQCPSQKAGKEGETSYLAVVGEQTAWPGSQGRRFQASPTFPGKILVVEATGYEVSWMEPRDMPFADAAAGVVKECEGTPGLICRHPCGGGEEPISGVYYGRAPGVVGYRLCGVNCIFEGAVLTASELVLPRTLLELLTVGPEETIRDNPDKKAK
ncbi:MAG TPA: DUF1559 domain-containing protein [Planctomycetaceae bacterium]|nr:DUF1559 domain-containing protein [Planctomycetaceae bacterium]